MQSKEKTAIDARPFPELYRSLTQGEKAFFNDKAMHNLKVTRQTIWKWWNAQTTPLFAHQREIVSIFTNMGYRTTTRTLFPES